MTIAFAIFIMVVMADDLRRLQTAQMTRLLLFGILNLSGFQTHLILTSHFQLARSLQGQSERLHKVVFWP